MAKAAARRLKSGENDATHGKRGSHHFTGQPEAGYSSVSTAAKWHAAAPRINRCQTAWV
jgi:hypothetical protein